MGAETPAEGEVEITPEMVRAGAEVIWRCFGDVVPYGSSTGDSVATQVFQAMTSARVSEG